jgi:hypothetical protein
MNCQKYDDKNPNQYQRMLRFFLDGLIEPLDQFRYPAWCFKGCRRLEDYAYNLAVWFFGLDMVRYFLVVAAVLLIFGAVLEQHSVELLDVVFRGRNGREALKNHVHRIGIARHFLLVTTCKRIGLDT